MTRKQEHSRLRLPSHIFPLITQRSCALGRPHAHVFLPAVLTKIRGVEELCLRQTPCTCLSARRPDQARTGATLPASCKAAIAWSLSTASKHDTLTLQDSILDESCIGGSSAHFIRACVGTRNRPFSRCILFRGAFSNALGLATPATPRALRQLVFNSYGANDLAGPRNLLVDGGPCTPHNHALSWASRPTSCHGGPPRHARLPPRCT